VDEALAALNAVTADDDEACTVRWVEAVDTPSTLADTDPAAAAAELKGTTAGEKDGEVGVSTKDSEVRSARRGCTLAPRGVLASARTATALEQATHRGHSAQRRGMEPGGGGEGRGGERGEGHGEASGVGQAEASHTWATHGRKGKRGKTKLG
jgi:hypothetical protein